jgi:putative membrane protein
MVYGASLIIPGLSGGTFLVVFGCYDKICAAFALDFKTIKKHFIFYALFGVGAAIGLLGFLFAVGFLLSNFETQTYLFFLGLIMGGMPIIIKNATSTDDGNKVNFKPLCLIPFVLGLALIIGISLIPTPASASLEGIRPVSSLWVAFCGMVAAVAMVLPGISGAFVLVAFDVYDVLTNALRALDFEILLWAGAGIVIGIVGGARLIRVLLKKYKMMVYSAIIGMVLGSVVPVVTVAQPDMDIDTLIGFVCMLVGIVIVARLGKITKPNE